MIPSGDDTQFFAEQGYWLAPRLFDEATIRDARAHAASVCEGIYEKGEAPQLVYPVTDPAKGLRKFDNAWWADRVIESIATSPAIGQIAATLLGVREIYLWHDQLLWKPGGSEEHGNVGWHQDKGYWTASSTSDMLTAWVAFDDVTAEMGAMRFVAGSNHWGSVITNLSAFFETDHDAQRRAVQLPAEAEWREVVAAMPAGHASFHHCKTIHASGPNRTDRARPGLAVHLMSGEARLVKGRGHPNEALFDAEDGALWRGPRFPRLWPPETK